MRTLRITTARIQADGLEKDSGRRLDVLCIADDIVAAVKGVRVAFNNLMETPVLTVDLIPDGQEAKVMVTVQTALMKSGWAVAKVETGQSSPVLPLLDENGNEDETVH